MLELLHMLGSKFRITLRILSPSRQSMYKLDLRKPQHIKLKQRFLYFIQLEDNLNQQISQFLDQSDSLLN